jgi:hypothetical protein
MTCTEILTEGMCRELGQIGRSSISRLSPREIWNSSWTQGALQAFHEVFKIILRWNACEQSVIDVVYACY